VTRTVSLPAVAAPFEWTDPGGTVLLQARLGNAHAVFSTRLGGVSEGPYESLNLGILTDDVAGRVRQNRSVLAEAVGRDPASVAMGRQVHGARVQLRAAPPAGETLEEVDGQVTASPAVTPLVLVADCVPLVLAAPGAVAAVHCGWRGVAAGIVGNAVRELAGEGPVVAAVGPGIGPCCYEVGPDVLERFASRGHDLAGPALDLPAVVATELQRAGVGSIAVAGICVSCNAELFFSHRRDGGVTGRQAGLAWLVS
jgi:YfiH family protein